MGEFLASVRSIRFGVFEVDLRAGELKKRGIRIRLQGQPYLLLVTLLKQRGEMVTREELRRTLWPEDTFVDFDHGLGSATNKLRDALGDSATNPRFIETVPRRGYRFIAPFEAVEDAEAAPMRGELPPDPCQPAATDFPHAEDRLKPDHPADAPLLGLRLSRSKIIPYAVVVLGAGLLTFLFLRSRPPALIRSLAVLPLENLSGDPAQEYFSDGMTDELITELGQIAELRVISRTSVMTYKGARKALPQIARELNVDAAVEGTVLRSGNSVRITAQLILASTDKHL